MLVREPGVVGELHAPAGRPLGAVVALGGSEGGVEDGLGAALAEAGFLALSLAYFGAEGLPPQLVEVPVETAGRALEWLRARAGGARVAVAGASKGGELALLAASRCPEHVCAVVAFAGSPLVWQGIAAGRDNWTDPRSSWTAGGEPLAFVPYGRPDAGTALRLTAALLARRPPPLFRIYERALRDGDAVARATMPLERIDGPILLVSGGADRMWPAPRLAELAVRRRHGRAWHLCYEGAGHAAGLPPRALDRRELGGSDAADAAAHADAWPRVLTLLAGACA